jgi:DNA-binding PadR family transcriptional regulator
VMERDLVLLGVLRQGAMHGYRIAEIVEKELSSAVELKRSTTYYLLERLAKDGYLHRDRVPAGKRPTRYVYQLTERGKSRFFELLRQNLEGPNEVRFAGDAGLAFLDELEPSEVATLLARKLSSLEEALEAVRTSPPSQGQSDLLWAHQESFLVQEIAWVEQLIEQLGSKSSARSSASRMAS